MNNRWKKLVSLFLALSIVCSLVVIPASAAGTALTLSAENGAWSGQQYKVDVVAKGSGSFNAAVAAITVGFDKDLLTFVGAEDKTGFSMVVAPNVSKANEDGSFNLGPTDGAGGKTFTSTMPIATLTFQLKDGVENQDTQLTFSEVSIETGENEAHTVTANAATVSITNGVAPTVETVAIDPASVTVDGTNGATATATATSKAGTDISSTVAWTVSPADAGVTVDKGTVTVAKDAKAGEYTIGAGTKTATLTVSRAAAVATSIVISQNGTEIEGDAATLIKPTAGKTNTYTYTAKVLDQYGDPFEGDVTWTSSGTAEGVTVASSVVTVSDTAVVDSTLTLTAAVGEVTKTLTLTVKDIDITWPTVTADGGVYGQTWGEIVKVSGGSASLNGTNVPGKFTVQEADEKPRSGSQNFTLVFKSDDGVYTVAESAARTATIAKKPIEVQMDDFERYYQDEINYYEFNKVVTGSVLVVAEDGFTVEADGEARKGSPVGVYAINRAGGNKYDQDDYAVTVKAGKLTILPKSAASTTTMPTKDIETIGDITSGTGSATVKVTVENGNAIADSAKALADAIFKAFGGQKKITVTIDGSDVELTVTGWKLADGQKYNYAGGTYLFVPTYAEAAGDNVSSPAAPAFLVTIPAAGEGTVTSDLSHTLYTDEILDAKSLSDLGISGTVRISYEDGTSIRVNVGWPSDLLDQLKSLARKLNSGDSKTYTFSGSLPLSANAGSSVTLTIRMRGSSSSSGSTGTTNNRGTGSNLSFTLDADKLFLNNLPKDVSSTYWAANYIGWAYARGVMNGMSDGNFHPEGLTNRQQLWMVLDRLSGNKPANMAEARAWSISSGISDGTNPGGSLTRQQLVTMLYRYAQLKGYATTGGASLSGYADAGRVSSYAQAAMSWAVGNGIVGGTTDGRLNPQGTATRAHFATFLYRFCLKYGA